MADFNDKFNEFNNTKDTTAEFDQNDIQQNKAMAILAYLSWLVLIPLFAAKDSKFAKFHCNQGLTLFICSIACSLLMTILAFIPFVRWIGFILGSLLGVAILILAILGIINAANGQAKELPIIGKFTILK